MRIYKLIALFAHLLIAVLFTFLLSALLRIPSSEQRYRTFVVWWYQRVCNIFGIQRSIIGKPETATTLYVANHVSWLDIPLLASIVDPHFLSKAEVRSWPLLGWIAEKSGTLFIQRGNRSAAKSAHHEMVKCLTSNESNNPTTSGHSVLFFPEGTTANGHDVLRFRARLFDTAIVTQTPIQPIVIYYPDSVHGVNPKVPFIGAQSLVSNIWTLLGERHIPVEVHFLAVMDTNVLDRKELATSSEEQIRERLIQQISTQKIPKNTK